MLALVQAKKQFPKPNNQFQSMNTNFGVKKTFVSLEQKNKAKKKGKIEVNKGGE